jgi:hypothetical protein
MATYTRRQQEILYTLAHGLQIWPVGIESEESEIESEVILAHIFEGGFALKLEGWHRFRGT